MENFRDNFVNEKMVDISGGDGGVYKEILDDCIYDSDKVKKRRPKVGEEVRVLYEGQLKDGTVFDSCRERAQPFKFHLGQGEVIKGWDIGIAAMYVGEQSRLTMTSDYGYGAQGSSSGKIPPHATLTFYVTLLGCGPLNGEEKRAIKEYNEKMKREKENAREEDVIDIDPVTGKPKKKLRQWQIDEEKEKERVAKLRRVQKERVSALLQPSIDLKCVGNELFRCALVKVKEVSKCASNSSSFFYITNDSKKHMTSPDNVQAIAQFAFEKATESIHQYTSALALTSELLQSGGILEGDGSSDESPIPRQRKEAIQSIHSAQAVIFSNRAASKMKQAEMYLFQNAKCETEEEFIEKEDKWRSYLISAEEDIRKALESCEIGKDNYCEPGHATFLKTKCKALFRRAQACEELANAAERYQNKEIVFKECPFRKCSELQKIVMEDLSAAVAIKPYSAPLRRELLLAARRGANRRCRPFGVRIEEYLRSSETKNQFGKERRWIADRDFDAGEVVLREPNLLSARGDVQVTNMLNISRFGKDVLRNLIIDFADDSATFACMFAQLSTLAPLRTFLDVAMVNKKNKIPNKNEFENRVNFEVETAFLDRLVWSLQQSERVHFLTKKNGVEVAENHLGVNKLIFDSLFLVSPMKATREALQAVLDTIGQNAHEWSINGMTRGVAIGFDCTYLNHSCWPSCECSLPTPKAFEVRTLRRIEKGEEMTISYTDLLQYKEDRQARLATVYG
eukprot:g5726.t1